MASVNMRNTLMLLDIHKNLFSPLGTFSQAVELFSFWMCKCLFGHVLTGISWHIWIQLVHTIFPLIPDYVTQRDSSMEIL